MFKKCFASRTNYKRFNLLALSIEGIDKRMRAFRRGDDWSDPDKKSKKRRRAAYESAKNKCKEVVGPKKKSSLVNVDESQSEGSGRESENESDAENVHHSGKLINLFIVVIPVMEKNINYNFV